MNVSTALSLVPVAVLSTLLGVFVGAILNNRLSSQSRKRESLQALRLELCVEILGKIDALNISSSNLSHAEKDEKLRELVLYQPKLEWLCGSTISEEYLSFLDGFQKILHERQGHQQIDYYESRISLIDKVKHVVGDLE